MQNGQSVFFLSPHTERVRLARFARKTLTPRFTDFFSDLEKKNRPFCSLRKTLITYGGRQLCILIKGRQGKTTTSLKFIPLSLLPSILLADRSHRGFRGRMGSPFYPSTLSFRKPRSFFGYSSGCCCFLHSCQRRAYESCVKVIFYQEMYKNVLIYPIDWLL